MEKSGLARARLLIQLQIQREIIMYTRFKHVIGCGLALAMMALCGAALAQAKKPNILVIMGDDIGIWNIGAYHRGMMAGRTPSLDQLARQGMIFPDYSAE